MNFSGKIAVKANEMPNGFILWRDFLIVPERLKKEAVEENVIVATEAEITEEIEITKGAVITLAEEEEEENKKPNAIRIYNIQKKLTDKEIEYLEKDVDRGIEKIAEKLGERGPIILKADRVYIDDILLIQIQEDTAIIGKIKL
ncbi:MAG: hypothetical protein HFJ34_03255 [Clostridia bacterium]|nr:hypothetical protein [Clostridia bacterium]